MEGRHSNLQPFRTKVSTLGDKVGLLHGVGHTCDLRASDTMMRRNVAIIAVAVCSHLSIVDALCNLTGSWTGSGSDQPGPLIEVGEPSDACKRSHVQQPHLTALLHCCTHTRHSALAHPPPVHNNSLHCSAVHSLTHAALAMQYSPTHSLILSLVRSLDLPMCTPTHAPMHPPTHSLTHSLNSYSCR
jgi:hypothetical protein